MGIVKKNIFWITADAFVDCDFNPQILSGILKFYNIKWLILLPAQNARFKENDFESLKKLQGLSISFLYENYRARDPRMLFFYEKLYWKIKREPSEVIYFNNVPSNPYILPLYWRLNKSRTIFTAHDGNVKPTFKFPWISKMTFQFAFGTVKYVNMFSQSQAKLFANTFCGVKIFETPLGLKDFGQSTLSKRKDNITFLFFGTIHPGKNLGLLIDAACSLFEEGQRGFKISINGSCANWEIYQQKIKYPELFELNIRMIENAEIPKLFAQNHYMVFPYKEMSQSGALKVAFNYNVPVIVSDLEGFTDEVKDCINGYVFESENIVDLKKVMTNCIINHRDDYLISCKKMNEHTQKYYYESSIALKYIEMFETIVTTQKIIVH